MYSCAVTSVKPTRFKFGYKEDYSLCKKIKRELESQFKQLHDKKLVQCFYVGGSLGVDIWAGEILLRLKEQAGYEDIQLILVLPFPDYQKDWDLRSQKRLAFLKKHSAVTCFIGKSNNQKCYVDRNRYMADHSEYLVAVGSDEDTLQMVKYAKEQGRKIIYIHPDTANVTE